MRSELRSSLVIVAQEGNATPSRDAVPDRVAVEVVDEKDRRCRRLQADADVLNEGSKVNERRSTGSHKVQGRVARLVGDEPGPGPTITALPNRGRRDPCLK
jgi:hypothetical protein